MLEILGHIAALGAFGFALGRAFDLYLLDEHKSRLYSLLEKR